MSFLFGRPSCELALRCVWAPNLRTCLALRWGAQLADVPCVVLGQPTLVRLYLKVYIQAKICSYPSSSSSFSLVLPCVDVFIADEFCVWATILRTCLSLRFDAQLADVRTCLAFALRTCIGAPNLRTFLALRWGTQLADMPCVAFGCPSCGRALSCVGAPILQTCLAFAWQTCVGRPTCGRALHCVGAPNLRTCLALHWGAQLSDVPCVAFGRPSCRRALCCVGAPNPGEVVLKSLPPSQNLLLSILQLVV
jgi:hypothetical protein